MLTIEPPLLIATLSSVKVVNVLVSIFSFRLGDCVSHSVPSTAKADWQIAFFVVYADNAVKGFFALNRFL